MKQVKTKFIVQQAMTTKLLAATVMVSAAFVGLSFAGMIATQFDSANANSRLAKNSNRCVEIDQQLIDNSSYNLLFEDVPCVVFTDHDNNPKNNIIDVGGYKNITFDGDFKVDGKHFKLINNPKITLKDRVKLKNLEVQGVDNAVGVSVGFRLYDSTEVMNTKADNFARAYDIPMGSTATIRNSYASNSDYGFMLWAGQIFDSKAEFNNTGFFANFAEMYNVEAYYNKVGLKTQYDSILSGGRAENNSELGVWGYTTGSTITDVVSKNNANGGVIYTSNFISDVDFSDNDGFGLKVTGITVVDVPGRFCDNGDTDLILEGLWNGQGRGPIIAGQFVADDVEIIGDNIAEEAVFVSCNKDVAEDTDYNVYSF